MDASVRCNVFPPILPYRCGAVCKRALAGGTSCLVPNGMGNDQPCAIDEARKRGGPCGPEAMHLRFRS